MIHRAILPDNSAYLGSKPCTACLWSSFTASGSSEPVTEVVGFLDDVVQAQRSRNNMGSSSFFIITAEGFCWSCNVSSPILSAWQRF